jgi:hypothetical protein
MNSPAVLENISEIRPRQVWAGKQTETTIEIVSSDSSRSGRWIVLVHSVGLTASFDTIDICGRYDLVSGSRGAGASTRGRTARAG